MKKTVLITLALLIACAFSVQAMDFGLEYHSTYYWRGVSFYGDYNGEDSSPRGVFFPWVGTSVGDFYFTLAGEIPASLPGDGMTELEEDWLGVDFIASWSMQLGGGAYTLGTRAAYFMYPNQWGDDWSKKTADFAEARLTFSMNEVPLSPTLLVSWYYRFGSNIATQAEDLYIELSAGESIALNDNASLNIGGSVSSFNYPSAGFEDWFIVNDIKLSAGISTTSDGGVTFSGQYSFGVTIPDELVDWTGRFNHWASFSVSYSL